ncbi:MAG: hypothetical protein QM688_16655, partial [Sphingomonas bacterium]
MAALLAFRPRAGIVALSRLKDYDYSLLVTEYMSNRFYRHGASLFWIADSGAAILAAAALAGAVAAAQGG